MTFWEKLSQFGFEALIFIVLVTVIVIVEAVVTSKNVKTGHKTALMVVTQAFAGVIGLLCWNSGNIPLCIFAAVLAVGFLIGCLYGHRKGWKQADE